ncbi:MAG: DUF3795 domain-containing protein [Kiritimatiellales bacterium]|nr:DUF3795 domain-containing protein [Kiritimatiellales bacterium]
MSTKKINRRTFTATALCAGCATALVGCKTNETAGCQKDMGAYCGLYCGTCPLYTGGKCTGCKGPTETLADHCKACKMRPCAQAKGIKSCAECPGFPCEKTEAFHNSGKPMGKAAATNCKTIQEIGYDQWLAGQEAK